MIRALLLNGEISTGNGAIWLSNWINAVPGLSCRTPGGAFYLYVNCSGVIGRTTPEGKKLETDMDFVMYLLEGVGVVDCRHGLRTLSPYFRMSIATSDKIIEEGCRRIAQAVNAPALRPSIQFYPRIARQTSDPGNHLDLKKFGKATMVRLGGLIAITNGCRHERSPGKLERTAVMLAQSGRGSRVHNCRI